MADLGADLRRLDGKPYPAYRDLRGRSYEVGGYSLRFAHIQGDPFASPSRIEVEVGAGGGRLPGSTLAGSDSRRAAADFLHRLLWRQLRGGRDGAGSGKSGLLELAPVGQEVLERTGVRLAADGSLLVLLFVGLPAAGRRILGRGAAQLLTERLVALLDEALATAQRDREALCRHVRVVEDQVELRQQLSAQGLVAFVGEGSVLPRRSGADDRPMAESIPLAVPDSLAVELETPHAGRTRGIAIRRGVTLIIGGGYHGKSTLLQAIARGVYDHVPGDGRELCVSVDSAVAVRAEDGRSVCAADLRPFISRLPLGRKTDAFDTDDASGSTSQAAAIIESLEAGARCLLIDEDTAATNFMIRDARMRALVPADGEPITPFLDRVVQLHEECGVSSILVVGGAGDYLDVADTVIRMKDYRPEDVTSQARAIARQLPLGEAAPRKPGPWPVAAPRVPDPRSLDASRGKRAERVRGIKTRSIEFGREEIDVSLLPQLVDPAQCRMIGDVLLACSRVLCDGVRSVSEVLDEIDAMVGAETIAALAAPGWGDRALPRRFEIAAALNRLRSLAIIR